MKRIESKEDIKLFRRLIKNEIKKEIAEKKRILTRYKRYGLDKILKLKLDKYCDITDNYGFELLNDDNEHICHLCLKPNYDYIYDEYFDAEMGYTDDRLSNKSIMIYDFMHNSKFDLNERTSDYRIRIIVDKIINKYNAEVDRWAKILIECPDFPFFE